MKLLQTLLVLFMGMTGLLAQEVAVSGTVTDEEGNPLEGASVYVAEISVGTTTDANGNYELLLKEGKHIIQFSYIGFSPVP